MAEFFLSLCESETEGGKKESLLRRNSSRSLSQDGDMRSCLKNISKLTAKFPGYFRLIDDKTLVRPIEFALSHSLQMCTIYGTS